MDKLVTNTLHGNLVDNVNWGNSGENLVVGDRAIVGKKVSRKNLGALTNRTLPVWVLKYGQQNNDINNRSF